jgi:long-chain acyl-CoA synthetase
VREVVGGPKNFFAAGGAPLSPEVAEFFFAAGLLVCEGYGLTETAPVISCNYPAGVRFGTVGRPVTGCEVRIADDGEIQVRGANVMTGYWHDPKATADAFVDGWLRTGDVGQFDHDGFLRVTDRIKDLIVTAQGKNIAPQPIESRIAADPLIEHVVVIGDRRPYLVALVQPSFPELVEYAAHRAWGLDSPEALMADPRVNAVYVERAMTACADLPHWEQPHRIALVDAITLDGGLVTPTLKVRRRAVASAYAEVIDGLYAGT